VNTVVSGNTSESLGGGIFCFTNDSGVCNLSLINVTVSGNTGSIFCSSGTVSLLNTIIWGNLLSLNSRVQSSNQCYIAYSIIQGGKTGIETGNNVSVNWLEGNRDIDPLFINATNGNYHLSDNSPCIGTGIDSIEINRHWYYAPTCDCKGNSRPNPVGSRPDMGAYENPLSTDVVQLNTMLPKDFILFQNYPNPFNTSTTIKFALPKTEKVKVEVFNVLGQKVATLVYKQMPANFHEIEFNAMDLPSGIYTYRILAGKFQAVKKMLFIK
jgi:hypothetical protein